MNKKFRNIRAVVAVSAIAIVVAIKADEFSHVRAGAEFSHDLANNIVAVFLGIAVALFAWNVVQYAKHVR
jgi:hypothetical protein